MKKLLVVILVLGATAYLWFTWQGFNETAVVQQTEVHLTVELGADKPNNCYIRAKFKDGTYLTGYMHTSACYSLEIGKARVKADSSAPGLLKNA